MFKVKAYYIFLGKHNKQKLNKLKPHKGTTLKHVFVFRVQGV